MRSRPPTPENTAEKATAHGANAPFLRSVARRDTGDATRFPFSVPVIRTLETLAFSTPVTFFVGENGSGKSTLLEGIATAARLPAVGSSDMDADATHRAPAAVVPYDELDHVVLTREFLNAPERYLRALRQSQP